MPIQINKSASQISQMYSTFKRVHKDILIDEDEKNKESFKL